jgi:anti-anti-sigma regulatory factor
LSLALLSEENAVAHYESATVEIIDDDPPTLLCKGGFDLASVDLVTDALVEISDSHPSYVLLDFRPTSFIGPAALSRLADEVERCDGMGTVVELDPCPFLQRLFEQAGGAYAARLRLAQHV